MVPRQGGHLASPHPGRDEELPHGEQPALGGCADEPLELLPGVDGARGEGAGPDLGRRRRVGPVAGVADDQPPAHRIVEGLVQLGVDAPDGRRGEPPAELRVAALRPTPHGGVVVHLVQLLAREVDELCRAATWRSRPSTLPSASRRFSAGWPPAPAGWCVHKRVSLAIASEIAMTGGAVDGSTARRLDLVNRVVPGEQVLDAAVAPSPSGSAATPRWPRGCRSRW